MSITTRYLALRHRRQRLEVVLRSLGVAGDEYGLAVDAPSELHHASAPGSGKRSHRHLPRLRGTCGVGRCPSDYFGLAGDGDCAAGSEDTNNDAKNKEKAAKKQRRKAAKERARKKKRESVSRNSEPMSASTLWG